MKKILIITTTILLTFSLLGCSKYRSDFIFTKTGLDPKNKNITLINKKEGEISFNGDGIDFYVYEFKTKENIVNQIKKNTDWRTLPLSENLENIIYGKNGYSPFITNEEGKNLIPQIKKGYYYFYNTNEDAKNKTDDTYLKNTSSYNFILAIFDSINNRFYYVKFDT